MKGHVLLWLACVAVIAYLRSGSRFELGSLIDTAWLVACAVGISIVFGIIRQALGKRGHKRFGPGKGPLETIWDSITLALGSILLALSLNEALQAAGWHLPFQMVILTPISAVIMWLATGGSGGDKPDKSLQKPIGTSNPFWRRLLLALLFGLALGLAAQSALLLLDYIAPCHSTSTQGEHQCVGGRISL